MKPLLVALALVLSTQVEAQKPVASLTPSLTPLSQQALPPLPFRYVGTLRDKGRLEVLLMRGAQLHSIAPGDSIDGEYRVDAITDSTISFTYLPLETKQTWAFRR